MRPNAANLVSALILGVLFTFAIRFHPDPAVAEAYLHCPGSVQEQFPDMLACAKHMAPHAECTCFRAPSRWSSVYWILVPLVIGGAAAFAIRAKLVSALAILASTLAVFGAIGLAWLHLLKLIDVEGIIYAPFEVAVTFGISAAAYGIVTGGRYYWQKSRAT